MIFGVSVVRDEADIVALSVRHHLALGLDRVIVVDNGSSDGTHDVLDSLAGEDTRFSWRSIPTEGHPQAEIFTALAREAHAQGAEWLMPFDADEFWDSHGRPLRELLSQTSEAVLSASIVNFVQERRHTVNSPRSLATMNHRALPHGQGMLRNRELVENGEVPWICVDPNVKVLTRVSAQTTISMGNHSAQTGTGGSVFTDRLRVMHAPLRSQASLHHKAQNGRRVAKVYAQPNVGWHSKRFARLEDQGVLEAEWEANSQLDGHLHLAGRAIAVAPDGALVAAVARWL